MNMSLIRKRKRELCGITRNMKYSVDYDGMAIAIKLLRPNRPVTNESIILEKMRYSLPYIMGTPYAPFCEAIMELYKKTL